MKTIVRILNYYLNPIFNNDLDICVQLTRVSWWVFGNFITISIETKCRSEGQDVTTIPMPSFIRLFHLKIEIQSFIRDNRKSISMCFMFDPPAIKLFTPNLIRRGDSKQLSPFSHRDAIIVTASCRAFRTSEGADGKVDGPGVYVGGVRET